MKKKALRALADLALATGDNDGANAYFKQFLELDPNNAQLWLERGDAMLAAGKRDVALDSYTAAEKLLGSRSGQARRGRVAPRPGARGHGQGRRGGRRVPPRDQARAQGLLPRDRAHRPHHRHLPAQAVAAPAARAVREGVAGGRARPLRVGHARQALRGDRRAGQGDRRAQEGRREGAVGARDPAPADPAARELRARRRGDGAVRGGRARGARRGAVPARARRALLAPRRREEGARRARAARVAVPARRRRAVGDRGHVHALGQGRPRDRRVRAARQARARRHPSHLVTLGEQYWTRRATRRSALATWKRIIANGKATSHAKLGEVMAEHNQPDRRAARVRRGDQARRQEPRASTRAAPRSTRAEATATRSPTGRWCSGSSARSPAIGSRGATRASTTCSVTMVGGAKDAEKRTSGTASSQAPPDLEAGYMLVEYFASARSKDEPRTTLEKLHSSCPTTRTSMLDLVKAYQDRARYDNAVALLMKLAQVAPSREREVYQQITRDQDRGAQGRRGDRVGAEGAREVAERSDRLRAARRALRRDAALPRRDRRVREDDRARSEERQGELRARRAVRADRHADEGGRALPQACCAPRPTPERSRRAPASQAIDLEEMTDTLGELEKVHLAAVVHDGARAGVSARPRRSLPALRAAPGRARAPRQRRSPQGRARRARPRSAPTACARCSKRCATRKTPTQQRIAVQVLGHLGNKGAAAPLVHMARQEPPKDQRRIGTLPETVDREIRIEALVAAGRLGDPAVLDDVLPLMDHTELAMKEAATFTLGRSGDKRAVPRARSRRSPIRARACRCSPASGCRQIDDPRAASARDRRRQGRAAAPTRCAPRARTRSARAATPPARRRCSPRSTTTAATPSASPRGRSASSASPRRSGRSSARIFREPEAAATSWCGRSAARAALASRPRRSPISATTRCAAPSSTTTEAVRVLPGALPHGRRRPPGSSIDHVADISAGLTEALGEHRDVVVSVLSDLDAARRPPRARRAHAGDRRCQGHRRARQDRDRDRAEGHRAARLRRPEGARTRGLGAREDGLGRAPARSLRRSPTPPTRSAPPRCRRSRWSRSRGRCPRPLVAALVKVAGAPGWADRRAAVLALGKLGHARGGRRAGQGGRPTRPASSARRSRSRLARPAAGRGEPLEALAKDEVPQVREAATRSLGAAKP